LPKVNLEVFFFWSRNHISHKMAKHKPNPKASLPFKVGNKLKRQDLQIQRKKARDIIRRDERLSRKREEDRNPELKRERLARNVPQTIDRKRTWDDVDGDGLGVSIDVEELARRRIETAEQEAVENSEEEGQDDDRDSMLDSDEEADEEDAEEAKTAAASKKKRSASIAGSTTTNLDLTPESLALKFPTLFSDLPPPTPKILLTTSINSTLHAEAQLLCSLFPNSNYVPRSAHRYGHKYSIREIRSVHFVSNSTFR